MSYVFIEGCCGSAAISLHLSGFKSPILSYQGSKWRYRKRIEEVLIDNKFMNKPGKIKLYDPGPWSRVIDILKKSSKEVILQLKEFSNFDPFTIYQSLQGNRPSQNEIVFAAEFLFLQRLSFSGKAVGCKDNLWKSPGFNKACAYGIPGTSKFGTVHPMIPSLIKNLESMDFSNLPLIEVGNTLPIPNNLIENTVLYLDPPYEKSTRYPDGDLSRSQLISLALSYFNHGAKVIISEAEPIKDLNWNSICISNERFIDASFKSKKSEWLTISP